MIEIKVDNRVLAALRRAFPKPANSAQRALDKYVNTLTALLIQSLSRGATPLETKLNAFSLSLHDLANKGGQIGSKKTRLHAWLRENDLALVEPIEVGSNLTGTISKVKFTDLVTLTWHEPETAPGWTVVDGIEIQTHLLADFDQLNREIFEHLYPDYEVCVADKRMDEAFDSVDIDTRSLRNYIHWLQEDAEHFTRSKREHYLFQARLILAVAVHTGGKYYQRKIHSDFGRTYYKGTSAQNVNKQLRHAMLGDCWEYDIRSSVIAWKMGFAEEYVQSHNPAGSVNHEFAITLAYLSNKAAVMKNVQSAVFGKHSDLPEDLQLKMLKQAFTAISFGARHSSHGWVNRSGEWEMASIAGIFKRSDERERFMSDFHVINFAREQALLDDYLYEGILTYQPSLLTLPYLQTSSGRASKPKAIAYLYQHEETHVMDVVRQTLREFNHTVLANIHGAIVVRRRLNTDTKQEIELRMRELTKNPYWGLSGKQIKRWGPSLKHVTLEEQLHRQRIQDEEALAEGFVFTVDSNG